MRNSNCLIVLDDDQHTEQHYLSVLSLLFPNYENHLIAKICKLIRLEGSAKCIVAPLERIEFYQEKLAKYGIQSRIEMRLL